MKPFYETELGKLYHGDNLNIMPELNLVDLIYTDPPYNVGKGYGPGQDKLPDKEYLNRMYDVFELCFKLSDKVILHVPKKYLEDYLALLPKGNLIILRRGVRNRHHLPDHVLLGTTIESNRIRPGMRKCSRTVQESYGNE